MNSRRAGLLVALIAAVAGAACGSSSSTSTAPGTVPRCSVSVGATDLSVPATGGSGTLAITTARECAWTATSTAAWLTIRGTASGQGDGSVEYVAAANADPTSRQGALQLNDQRANVTQAAASCTMQLAESSASFTQAGGSGTITVRASSPQCSWTAASDSSWLVIRSGTTGTGNGTVAFDAAAAAGQSRSGTIVVAGLRFSVTESQGCTYAVTPLTYTAGAAGGTTTVAVTTGAGCAWTAASNTSWVTVAQGATGSGPGNVQIVVDPTDGTGRAGSVLVAGQVLEVTQSTGCTVTASPPSQSFGAQGGTGTASIQAGGGCGWMASSNVPWITLTGPTSGAGSSSLSFTVAAVTGPARTGIISVAGSQITITQSAGCTPAISPQSQQVAAAGGDVSVSVTAPAGCAWTATSGASWITVASGASGSGDGSVRLTVAATSGATRTGTATIAGQTFTVTQGSGCDISIAPTSTTIAAAGGTGSVAVTTTAGCAWTATSNAPWLSVTSGASGTDSGTVQFSAAATSGGSRSGTLTIGGQTFTVNQGSGCAFSIAPASASAPAAGGTGSVTVTAGAGCAWTATSNVPWLTVTGGGSGSGNGTVQYSAAATTGPARSGTLTIAGQTFTVNQGGNCTFSIAPPSASAPAGGGPGSVTVTAGAGCAWTAASGVSWLTVTAGATGSGNGSVSYTAAANTGAARSGALTIAGQTFTVNQASGCNYSVNPTTLAINALGGPVSSTVATAAGCSWTASSGVSWITVTSGATGNGNGTVQFSVGINIGSARSGTATVAGQTVTVNQAATLCTWTLNPAQRPAPANGGANTFSVAAGAGCPWTATSDVSWITVTSGASGSGNGTVGYTVANNGTNTARNGTITVAGQKFTVNQAR